MSTTNNVKCLKLTKKITVFECNISNGKRIGFINFDKNLFAMFRLRSEETEHGIEAFVLELIRLEQLIHIFEKFNLEFCLVGMIGPFLELPSDHDVNCLPFW
jgi:hypothetical protein